MMKKHFLLLVAMMLPLVASAHDIEVKNTDGVTIYYNYTNDGTELAVTFRGSIYTDYPDEYTGNVVIPEEVTYMDKTRKVTSIGDYAFGYCKELTSITIPNSVTNICGDAFYSCSGLTSITIPNSVTSIGENAFYMCSGLTSITIPNGVTSISYGTFSLCSSLTSVDIPNSVTNIGKKAFDEIAVSTIVSLIENPFAIYGSISSYKTFTLNTFNNAMLYVPTGTINKYKATEGWKDFNNIIEGVPSGIKGVHLDSDKDYPVYDINGRRLETPQRGINIINGKKVVIK